MVVRALDNHVCAPLAFLTVWASDCRDYRGNGVTGAVCGKDEAGVPCVMRDGGMPAPPSASCVLVDDQFAYIPREFADAFFRTDAAPTAAFSGPKGKAANKGKLHYVRIRLKSLYWIREAQAPSN